MVREDMEDEKVTTKLSQSAWSLAMSATVSGQDVNTFTCTQGECVADKPPPTATDVVDDLTEARSTGSVAWHVYMAYIRQ
jgi:hypothetical protein